MTRPNPQATAVVGQPPFGEATSLELEPSRGAAHPFTVAQFLAEANALLPRTQSDPHPVTSVNYALTRLRHHGLAGEALRLRAILEFGL